MHPVVVVGGGISGVACARALTDAGVDVRLLDRGRRLGGRMAVRTVEGHPVDIGASYFTVSDDRFAAVVADWQARGVAREWTDTFDVFDDGRRGEPKQGGVRWASPDGLRSLVEDLARGLGAEQAAVESVTRDEATGNLWVDGRPAAAVALAMPDPQARQLLATSLDVSPASSPTTQPEALAQLVDGYAPTMALLAGWSEPSWRAGWGGVFDGAFVNGDPHLTWVADDGSRRGDGAPVLVAHATADLAGQHLAEPAGAQPAMLGALTELLGIRESPEWAQVHRWSLAHPAHTRDQTYYLGDDGIGLCGDSWASKPRVEAAWVSGTELAAGLIRGLG